MRQYNLSESTGTILKLVSDRRWTEAMGRCQDSFICQTESLEKDTKWRHPLHLACCAFSAPVRQLSTIITHLIAASKNITDAQDRDGNTPLHLACSFGLDISCIKILLDANPFPSGIKSKSGCTPLALACQRRNTSSDTIQLLLSRNIHTASSLNEMGWSLIHFAIWHDLSLTTLIMLIRGHPEAAFVRTYSSNQTPLAMYWRHGNPNEKSIRDRNILRLLLNPYYTYDLENEHDQPRSSEHILNQNDCGLVHRVISFPQYIPGLMSFVITAFPEDVKKRDKFGRLPLHRIIQNTVFPDSDIKMILRAYPEASCQPEPASHKLPLIQAIETSRFMTWKNSVLEDLYHIFPDAIYSYTSGNQGGRISPFMLAGVCNKLDICFEILRLAPELSN